MVEEHPEEVEAVQHQLQDILLSVARTHTQAPLADVRQALADAIRTAGIPEQPKKWLTDAAGDISAGRLLVVNAHEEHLMHVGIRGQRTESGERVAQAVTTHDEAQGGRVASGAAATPPGEVLPDERRHP